MLTLSFLKFAEKKMQKQQQTLFSKLRSTLSKKAEVDFQIGDKLKHGWFFMDSAIVLGM